MLAEDVEDVEILIVGKDNPNLYVQFCEKLSLALKGTDDLKAPALRPTVISELNQMAEIYAQNLIPAIVAIDIASLKNGDDDEEILLHLIRGVRALDPGAFMIGLSHKAPLATDVSRWIRRGLMGWVKSDFDRQDLKDSLLDAFAERIQMTPRQIRVPARHQVEMKIASLEQASVAEVINLGMGGMFVRALPPNVKAGDKIDFKFVSSQQLASSVTGGASTSNPIDDLPAQAESSLHAFEGRALVVWVREQSSSEGPEGIGVQFLSLDSSTQNLFREYILKRKLKTFDRGN